MDKFDDIMDTIVYSLCGHDVMDRLVNRGLGDLPEEELEKIVQFIKHKMEIPWSEYIDCMLDIYFDDKNKNNIY